MFRRRSREDASTDRRIYRNVQYALVSYLSHQLIRETTGIRQST